jgi:4-amino-4-deoxy-L-arabinose transferase-like glycosyltransferase
MSFIKPSTPFVTFTVLISAIWMLSFYGIESIPLEKHEVFVLETSQTMLETGNWVLPQFNKELRLQKPPLSYWAPCGAALLDPFSETIRIYHGRLVSLLAGLGILLIVAGIGRKLFNEPAGMLAATFLLCMQGFLHLSYNARPDPLYGFFSLLYLFWILQSWRADDGGNQQRIYAFCSWITFALAILTKGPQVPILFLLGFVVFLWRNGERHRILHILCPYTGVPLVALILLPWSILLHERLQTAGIELGDTQLSGSLLTQYASWKDLLSFYYVIRLLPLLLPTLLLLPILLYKQLLDRKPFPPASRLLLTVLVTLLIVFTLGGQYRKHYLYPALPLIALLISEGLLRTAWKPLRVYHKHMLNIITGAGLLTYTVLLFQGHLPQIFVWAPLLVLGLWVLSRRILRDSDWPKEHVGCQLTEYGLVLGLALSGIYSTLPHRADRRANQLLVRHVADRLDPQDLVVSFSSDDFTLPFYLHRRVLEMGVPEAPGQLANILPPQRPLVVFLPEKALKMMNPPEGYEILERSMIPEDPEKNLVVIKVSTD